MNQSATGRSKLIVKVPLRLTILRPPEDGLPPGVCVAATSDIRSHLNRYMANAALKESGGDQRLLLRRRGSSILGNCSRTVLIKPGAERFSRSVANSEAMVARLSAVFPLIVDCEIQFIRTADGTIGER